MLHDVVAETLARKSHPHFENLTEEQKRAVEECLEYAKEIEDQLLFSSPTPLGIMIERHVTLDSYELPEIYGTADLIIFNNQELHVIDWKFGQGVPVYAEGNVQLQAYGLGAHAIAAQSFDIEKVVVHVVQPRLNSYTKAEYTIEQLEDRAKMFRAAINHAKSINPPYNAGEEQCRWCNAKLDCEARDDHANKVASEVFSAFNREPNVSDEEKASLLSKAPLLIKYLEEIKAGAMQTLLEGGTFPGHKLVGGRASRKWADETAAAAYLSGQGVEEDEMYERKFLTAPKAEKLHKNFKKDPEFHKLYVKTPGKPTVVPESDKRPEYKAPDASEIFKNFKG